MVPEGGNWRDLPEEIIPVAMGGAYKSGGGKVGFTVDYHIINQHLQLQLHLRKKRQCFVIQGKIDH